jgi:hypothetical protein
LLKASQAFVQAIFFARVLCRACALDVSERVGLLGGSIFEGYPLFFSSSL